jgi:hypothetical protein
MPKVTKAVGFALATILVLGICAAAQEQQTPAQVQAEKAEVKNFVLTTDKLDKYEAAIKATLKVEKENPALKKQMDDENSQNPTNSIAGSVATIEKHPPIATAIKNAGMSPRDFVVMTYALINSAVAVQMQKAATIKNDSDSVLPENTAFVEKNYERIKKIFNSASDSPSNAPPK